MADRRSPRECARPHHIAPSLPFYPPDRRILLASGPILSRHSFSTGAVVAAHWLKEQVESTGANCTLEPFLIGFAPNVICHYPILGGHEEEKDVKRVIISGHYDVRLLLCRSKCPTDVANDASAFHPSVARLLRLNARAWR